MILACIYPLGLFSAQKAKEGCFQGNLLMAAATHGQALEKESGSTDFQFSTSDQHMKWESEEFLVHVDAPHER